jgi:hypothetical protein
VALGQGERVMICWGTDAIALARAYMGTLEPAELVRIRNAEVLRLCSELMSADALASIGQVRHSDEYGTLLSVKGLDAQLVRVTCPSTGRVYHLRVPPDVTTAREAVAWTFGLRAEEYQPQVQA